MDRIGSWENRQHERTGLELSMEMKDLLSRAFVCVSMFLYLHGAESILRWWMQILKEVRLNLWQYFIGFTESILISRWSAIQIWGALRLNCKWQSHRGSLTGNRDTLAIVSSRNGHNGGKPSSNNTVFGISIRRTVLGWFPYDGNHEDSLRWLSAV